MGILLWIIFGGLVGWVASIIMGTNKQMGIIANIAVGVVGAFIGGFIMRYLDKSGVTDFNLNSFLVALLGSVILIGIFKVVIK